MGMKKFNKQGRKLEHNNIYFFVNTSLIDKTSY